MKKYAYKRIDSVALINDIKVGKDGKGEGSIKDVEEILNFYCANKNSEWELVTVAFDRDGHEILYLRKEVNW